MNRRKTLDLSLAAMFLAIGQVLPFITMQIPDIGKMLCPMHYPIILCGFICGPLYGAIVGFICPLLRGVLFSFPPLFPNGTAMAFELMTYGFVAGYLYRLIKNHSTLSIYFCLLVSMVSGRIVWGIVEMIIVSNFSWTMFISGALINAVPGIVMQLILIPLIMTFLGKGK